MSDSDDKLVDYVTEALRTQYKNHEVQNIWIIVSADENGSEGVPSVLKNGHLTPVMCTVQRLVPNLKEMVKVLKKTLPKHRFTLRHFSNPVDTEEL